MPSKRQFIKLLFYERFNLHRKQHCRMKKLDLLILLFLIIIFKTNAQSIIKQTGSNQQTNSLNTKSLAIKNAYTGKCFSKLFYLDFNLYN